MASFIDSIAPMAAGGVKVLLIAGGIISVLIIATIVSVVLYKRKKWNLNLNVKLPRSDGKLILTDKAKGYWDSENGWIVVKRKGYKPVHTRPIDPKRWLSGRDSATLIQVGPEDFIIAAEESYQILKDDVTGENIALMSIISDVGKRKTWKNYTERMGKKTFTLRGWAEKYQFYIALSILLFVMFIGFAILWSRIPSICQA